MTLLKIFTFFITFCLLLSFLWFNFSSYTLSSLYYFGSINFGKNCEKSMTYFLEALSIGSPYRQEFLLNSSGWVSNVLEEAVSKKKVYSEVITDKKCANFILPTLKILNNELGKYLGDDYSLHIYQARKMFGILNSMIYGGL